MKLSELLVKQPEMDVDLGEEEEGYVFLNGMYMFRVIRPDHGPGESTYYNRVTENTDGIIARGLLLSEMQISTNKWVEDDR